MIAAVGLAAFVNDSGAQVVRDPPPLTKEAFDANGQPITGGLTINSVVNFVLSAPPGTITDTLNNLTYVPGSLITAGWQYTSSTNPYGNGSETYTSLSAGPGTSLTVNVPGNAAAFRGPAAGDGFIPIPVGNRIFAIFHATAYLNAAPPSNSNQLRGAQIFCWDDLTLAACPNYPKPLDRSSTWAGQLSTPPIVHTVVRPPKIYFPAAQWDGISSGLLGIGCFDTSTEAPCPFIPVPSGAWSIMVPDTHQGEFLSADLAGIAPDPANSNCVFIFAIDRLHRVDLNGGHCNGWTPPQLSGTHLLTTRPGPYLIADPTMKQIYVHYGMTGQTAAVACFKTSVTAPTRCWPDATVTTSNAFYGALSLLPPDPNFNLTPAFCIHGYWTPGGVPPVGPTECFDTATGQSSSHPGALALKTQHGPTFPIMTSFIIPGTQQVLYGAWTDMPVCFDFSSNVNAPCTPFVPSWPLYNPGLNGASPNHVIDYGYAADPLRPGCFLGLGDTGFPWVFAADGSVTGNGCMPKIEQSFDMHQIFCGPKPPETLTITSIDVLNGPPTLDPNSLVTLSQGGQILWSGPINAATNLNIQVPVSQGPLTVNFQPGYGTGLFPGYQLAVNYTSSKPPQICYQATVIKCGPVSNMATFQVGEPIQTVDLSLGDATAQNCDPPLLKVCKVAGKGVPLGTPYTVTAGGVAISVPAGPPPGGSCMLGPALAFGSNVAVTESIPPGDTVTAIDVAPPNRMVGAANLASGSVNVSIGGGVTEVTFTNKRTGFLEICKQGNATGTFTFNLNTPGTGPIQVPAGACSPAMELPAGSVTITETPHHFTAISMASTIPPGRQGLWIGNSSTVTVPAGDVSTMTIAIITNAHEIPNKLPDRRRPQRKTAR